MDPWLLCQSQAPNSIPENNTITKFEDNFTLVNNKLPDSEQYLAILEEKLQRIKNDPNFLAQLSAKKEACMQELLSNTDQVNEDILRLDEPVSNSQILRTVAPQKQALTHGEIVELLKFDQLRKEDDLNVNKDSTSTNH